MSVELHSGHCIGFTLISYSHYATPIVLPDGRVRWVRDRCFPLQDNLGQVYRFTGIAEDITDRKQAMEAAEEGNQILDAMMEYIPVGVTIADAPDVRIRRVSRYGERKTGRSLELLENIPKERHAETWQVLHVDGITPANNEELPLTRAVQQGEIVTDEEWIIERIDGSKIHILCNAAPIRNQQGEITGGIIAWNDITNRKYAEAELQESEERFRTLADNISQLVWMADATGAIFWYNQRWFDYTGTTQEEMQRWGWQSVHHPDHVQQVVEHFRHCMETGELWEDTFPLRRSDGTYRWFLSRAIPIRDAENRIVRWFGTNTDIDDRIQAEQERDRLLKREQTARAEAERANRAKDEFLAILSHELRSPLNPILGWSKLLQTQKFDEFRTKQALATIERNAKLQSQLINDLLDVAKILRGKLVLNTLPVDLTCVIEAAIETVRTAAIAKSILIHPELNEIGKVSGDAIRLQQIVWNLLSNAIKFTPTGGRVDIRLERVDTELNPQTSVQSSAHLPSYAQITVTDTGKGINPEFLPHLFESFSQEDVSTTRKYGGLGLGLAIVRQLVEGHGGTISAISPGEGQGATFTVRLPLTSLSSDAQSRQTSFYQLRSLEGIRILTVDDEADARELLTVMLTQYDATVMTVATAEEVLAALETFQPNLLISDIGMPGVDGYALLQAVRSRSPEKASPIPAIALTAYAGEIDEQRAVSVGFQRHLAKPLEPEVLLQTILSLVRNS